MTIIACLKNTVKCDPYSTKAPLHLDDGVSCANGLNYEQSLKHLNNRVVKLTL